jgi:hypothetical protein
VQFEENRKRFRETKNSTSRVGLVSTVRLGRARQQASGAPQHVVAACAFSLSGFSGALRRKTGEPESLISNRSNSLKILSLS